MSPPGTCSVSLWTHVNFLHPQHHSCDFGSMFCWFTTQPLLFFCFVLYLLILSFFVLLLEVTANIRSLSVLSGNLSIYRPLSCPSGHLLSRLGSASIITYSVPRNHPIHLIVITTILWIYSGWRVSFCWDVRTRAAGACYYVIHS